MFKYRLVKECTEQPSKPVSETRELSKQFNRSEGHDVTGKRELPFFNTFASPVQRLKTELDHLNSLSGSLSNNELWDRYSQLFQEFNSLRSHTSSIPSLNGSYSIDKEDTSRADKNADEELDENLKVLLPKSGFTKANRLLTYIKSRLNDGSPWKLSEDGSLSRDGVTMDGNITDWILFAMTRRKLTTPPGYSTFLTLLKDLKVPDGFLIRKSTAARRVITPPKPSQTQVNR